ncbi:MAG: DUF4132 domain-containing protein [Myxococcales bacterium]|nr:DUF4132 domain-containing protein [Myxococcales bacterium]
MTTWTDLQRALTPAKTPIEDGIAHAPEATRELQRTLLDLLSRPTPPAPDVALYGAMLALFGPRPTYRHPSRAIEVARFAASVGGGGFLVDVVMASRAWSQSSASSVGIYTQELSWIEPARASDDDEGWLALREVLREDPTLRDEATKRAHAHLTEHGRHTAVHWALAAALPFADDLLTDDDLRHALRADDDPGTLFSVAVLREPSRRVAPPAEGWGVDGLPSVAELASLGGLRALAALRSHVRGFAYDPAAHDYEPYGSDGTPNATLELTSATDHVARLGGVDALRILAEAAHREKEVLPVLLRAMERDPDSARAAIDGLLAARLPKLDRYRESVIRRPLLVALRSMLMTDDVPEADTLPDDLASPPWSAAKKPAKTAKTSKKGAPTELREVPHEERLDWGKRDPATLFADEVAEDEAATLKWIDAEDDKTFFLFQVMRLKEETALRLLREIPQTRWYGQIDDVDAILARFGLVAIELLLPYVKRQPDRFPALLPVDSPRVAPLAGHLFATSKKVGDDAGKWLTKHPRAAAIGLVAALATAKGKDATSFARALEHVRAKAPKVVEEVLAAAGAETIAAEASASTKAAPKKAPKLPSFVNVEMLARPRLRDGRVLPTHATRTLVELLALSDRRAPHPALTRIAEACDLASLDRFAWGLFVLWLAAGGPPKHGFGLDVLGLFGAPATLRVLGERAREWAPGGLPQRAQAAVDVLALASGIAGVAAIHRLTQARSRALAKHAQKVLTARAKQLGLTKDDLVDRLVPDLGLDADGSASFDYGKRSFAMIVDDGLAPVIVDAQGKRLADLPKPRADEEELGQEAIARWKALKKDIKRALREQAPRLEQALALGRRFSVEHFEASFARHPLLQHLAQRLVWCAYDGDTRVATFGVTPDEYLDLDDRPYTPNPRFSIGLLHPIEATEDEVRRWGDRLADYRVVQPFPQLARSIHRLTDTERASLTLMRFAGRVVPTGKILGLDRRGWRRDASEQGGRVYAWQKDLGELVVVLPLDPGVYLGAPLDEPQQTLGPVRLTNESLTNEDAPEVWGDLSPVQVSELLADLEDLSS